MSRFLLRAILASIFAWLLGGAAAAPAAVTPPSEVVATYIYASHHDSLLRTHSASERGPPASYDNHMPGGAVDRGSHGASARVDGTTTAPVIEYDHSGAFVRGTRATGTTQEQAQSFDEALTSRGPVDVAAKSGPGAWGSAAESMSGRAAAYQARVTGGAAGSVYRVGGVKFDGFANGVLQEAKGPGYAKFVRNGQFQPWFSGADGLASQAQRQLAAARGTPITWSVAEADAATAINNLFMSRGISGINVTHVP